MLSQRIADAKIIQNQNFCRKYYVDCTQEFWRRWVYCLCGKRCCHEHGTLCWYPKSVKKCIKKKRVDTNNARLQKRECQATQT
jgi:hypothetical protein